MKKIILVLALFSSALAQPSLNEVRQKLEDLATRPYGCFFGQEAFKEVKKYLVLNPDIFYSLDEKTVAQLIVTLSERWSHSYESTVMAFHISPAFTLSPHQEMEEKVMTLFDQWASEYSAFKKAVHGQDVLATTRFLERSMPCNEIIYTIVSTMHYNKSQGKPDQGESKLACLIKAGADSNHIALVKNIAALNGAIRADDSERVKEMIKDIDLNNIPAGVTNPLFCACIDEKYSIAQLLIENGADINKDLDRRGQTILMAMVFPPVIAKGIRNVIKLGADINKKDKDGWTPLMHACIWYSSALHTFIELGADLDARNAQGKTALEMQQEFCDKYHKNDNRPDWILEALKKAAASKAS